MQIGPTLREGTRLPNMRRRKLAMALTAAGLFGTLVVPASAQLHRVGVTLVTGETLTVTVDVPSGASVDSVDIPGLSAPVESVVDLGAVSVTSPPPTATAEPQATPAATRTPSGNRQGADGALGTPSKGRTRERTAPPADSGSGSGSHPATLAPTSEALSGALETPAEPSPSTTPPARDDKPADAAPRT